MFQKPYVILKAATSIEGYLDTPTGSRAILSSDSDLEEVDRLRASVDAIFVGAQTLRSDNPSLKVKDVDLISGRIAMGLGPQPLRVSLSNSLEFDPQLIFFSDESSNSLIFSTNRAFKTEKIGKAEVLSLVEIQGPKLVGEMLGVLKSRGISRLLVEGGEEILHLFFESGCFNEFRLSVSSQSLPGTKKLQADTNLEDLECKKFKAPKLRVPSSVSSQLILKSLKQLETSAVHHYVRVETV